jgi:hypothetical protein
MTTGSNIVPVILDDIEQDFEEMNSVYREFV